MLYAPEELARETAKAGQGIMPYARTIIGLTVTTPEDAELASQCAEWAHETEKELTRRRDEILGPIAEAAARVRELFAPPIQACQRAKASAKGALGAWYQGIRETNTQAMQAAAQAAQAGDAQATLEASRAMVPVAVPQPVRLAEQWTYRVTAPDMLPREYLTIDYAKLKAHCKDSPTPIAGVVFEKTMVVAMRGKRG